MALGVNIAKARKAAGMTQEALAEQLDVARQTVSKWEAGTTVPTVPGLIRLAEVLRTDYNSLLGEEEKQPQIRATENGYVVDWTKLYPILVTYQQEMDCGPYEAQFAAMIREVRDKYGYSAEDAMLALKDIFAKTYFKQFQP
ncbi:helix-turn-helix transcriptional regulator [Anaerotignum lactatifermentans]|uniref:Helix-turn-helix transcriptional regulator n=1 Tax=Anaerotignum lactatifermentans TaxID=160404 RepID=A0ABS2GC82_9FIRM|nr:helix-turn-helix transcriptional regulator [Anaerotignum lactatifermentans]MBM6829901.1 helix-turn-helix transcriptional regulator [Anaerotignum lactatifermentans]MBM6878403.1 helix-turn-helix transcriptional regulator [Anaerotignum lactatifermentans]MBM6951558.1 helix-turn-helix transcriptional regulator [Anaerotignum lactatifermentans]